ncbi:MAG: PQQ-binding-like beta-propeller repeat protein [Bacteroidetes bacterium]|nr:PQQ-binding-like beta-propeller repeat protein [Bacteroidota bacterium]
MLNRKFFARGIILLMCLQQAVAQNSSPLQNRVINTNYDLVYDNKAWAFNAGAPVRSTPLIKNGIIYFGTAGGDFFAVNKRNAAIKWKFHSEFAIHSSASEANGKIFFSDNKQTVYALDEQSGKLAWKFDMEKKIEYPWRFDYYYSSPTLYGNDLFIGGDDGYLYRLSQATGKIIWKFRAKGLIRSTPCIYKNSVLFGDTEATFYSLDAKTGAKTWDFKIIGDSIDDYKYGYDKRAITSSAVTSGNKVFFGARDACLYALNADDGKFIWKISHEPSWIISTVAIKDSLVITGTSDGRFVQALNMETGKEIWKHHTSLAVWASPLVNNDKVYAGGFDGQLLCLDLKTGNRISEFSTNGIIFSSPVLSDSMLYFGSDDGNLYALRGRKNVFVNPALKRFVYYENKMPVYFHGGSEARIRNYLTANEFTVIAVDTLAALFSQYNDAKNMVIVSDGFYFPKKLWEGNENSVLRKYLDAGGRLIFIGNNPLFYEVDETTKEINLNIPRTDSVLGIHVGGNDTRAFGGLFPSLATEKGKEFGLPDFWVSNFGIDEKQADIILGRNENGQASAYVKKYNNGGRFIQVYINENLPMNLDTIIKLSEGEFE